MEQSGNILTCSREDNLIAEDPFENIEATLILKLIGSAIKLNSASIAYISVLLKDVMLLTSLNIATSCLLHFYSVIVK